MNSNEQPPTLIGVLEKIRKASEEYDSVSIEDVLHIVGRRSFGPILLIAGIITLAPLVGDIPGVPTVMGIIVFLIAIQILMQKNVLLLPGAILNRSLKKDRLHSAIEKLMKPAGFVDKALIPRLSYLTTGVMIYPVAIVCLCISRYARYGIHPIQREFCRSCSYGFRSIIYRRGWTDDPVRLYLYRVSCLVSSLFIPMKLGISP
jgi:hypothetical protein